MNFIITVVGDIYGFVVQYFHIPCILLGVCLMVAFPRHRNLQTVQHIMAGYVIVLLACTLVFCVIYFPLKWLAGL